MEWTVEMDEDGCKISTPELRKNEEIKNKIHVNKIIEKLSTKRLKLCGHIPRMQHNGWPKLYGNGNCRKEGKQEDSQRSGINTFGKKK